MRLKSGGRVVKGILLRLVGDIAAIRLRAICPAPGGHRHAATAMQIRADCPTPGGHRHATTAMWLRTASAAPGRQDANPPWYAADQIAGECRAGWPSANNGHSFDALIHRSGKERVA